MRQAKKPHDHSLGSSVLPVILFFCLFTDMQSAYAGKVSLSLGLFSYQATSGDAEGNKAGLASYNISFMHRIFSDRFEFEAAFTLIATQIFTGDLAFGPEIGFNYYPFSNSEPVQMITENAMAVIQDVWRPFIGAMFVQRSFRSVAASYAGVGFKMGFEKAISPTWSLRAVTRYILLSGPSESTATEMTFQLGVSLQF